MTQHRKPMDMTRIADELDAVTAGTAQATQKILAAAEEIDQLADNLSAALKGRLEQELAQDIADSVLRIFEACNFQDMIGQRVAKVMKTLAQKGRRCRPPMPARICTARGSTATRAISRRAKSTRCSRADKNYSGARIVRKQISAATAKAATSVRPAASEARSAT